MLYANPIIRRFGLGNKLLIWARAEAFAADHAARILKPSFVQLPSLGSVLRGERTWRTNFGNFDLSRSDYVGGWARRRILNRLPHVGETTWSEQLGECVVMFDGIGHDSFGAVLRHHEHIVSRLRLITNPEIMKEVDRLDGSPFIGVHLRRGDFRKVGAMTNDTWFVTAVRWALDRVGHIPVRVFTDGRPEEVAFLQKAFPAENIVIQSSVHPIQDIWSLSKSAMMVGSSGSSFSIWAVLLGQMPSVWSREHAPTPRDLYIDARRDPIIL